MRSDLLSGRRGVRFRSIGPSNAKIIVFPIVAEGCLPPLAVLAVTAARVGEQDMIAGRGLDL